MGRLPQRVNASPSYNRIGHIKCGVKEGKFAKSLGHFIATGPYAKQVHNIYGLEPLKFTILFVSPDDNISCDQREEAYDDSGKLGHAIGVDGKKEYYVIDQKTEKFVKADENDARVKKMLPLLKEVCTIRFKIIGLLGVSGTWELNTHGTDTSIPKLIEAFDETKKLAGDLIVHVPFDLILTPTKSKKANSFRKYPIVSVHRNLSDEALDRLSEYQSSFDKINKMSVLNDAKIFELTGGAPQLMLDEPAMIIDTPIENVTDPADEKKIEGKKEETIDLFNEKSKE